MCERKLHHDANLDNGDSPRPRFCAYHCGNRCCSHIKCSMNAGCRPMDTLQA